MTELTDEKGNQGKETSGADQSEDHDEAWKTEKASMGKILSLAKPEWPALFFAFIVLIGSEAAGLYNPVLIADAYNFLVDPTLTQKQRTSEISQTMALVMIIHTAGIVGGFLRVAIMQAAGERVVARVRNRLYQSILRQDIAFFDATKSGELVSRLSSDTSLLQKATSQALPEVLVGFVKFIAGVVLMFWLSPELAGVSLGCILGVSLAVAPLGVWLGKLSKRYQDALGTAQTYSTETLGGMRTVQSFAAEQREADRYEKAIGNPAHYPFWWPSDRKQNETTYSVGFIKGIVTSGFYTVLFGVGFGTLYVSLWYGFNLVTDGDMTLGDLTAFQSYIFIIGAALGQTSQFSQLIEAQAASGRIFYLMERTPLIPNDESEESTPGDIEEASKTVCDSLVGEVSFSNVNFAYPTRPDVPVLIDFSLVIPPNTTAALVGSSGAGKSTVVALIQRFYDVSSGSIKIDGRDIRELNVKDMRRRIGYVQQEPSIFGLSVRENIQYGVDREVNDGELETICRKANAHEFISKWPMGYDTLVGERGVKLSGGQKQRLAIARALLVDPRILLLDEATSALDAESEHQVQEAIEKAAEGRTTIIVAHRLSTIRRASQIVVVDKNGITDVGTHDELIGRCNKYQDLIKRQSMIGKHVD